MVKPNYKVSRAIKLSKWLLLYIEVTFNLANGMVSYLAIGLPIFPATTPIIRSINSNANLSEKPRV